MNTPPGTSIKVRLTTDLTHYHPALAPGSEGYTIGVYGQCSRISKRFTGVWFPGIQLLDVDWASLEVIDGLYLARQVAKRPDKRHSLAMAVKSLATLLR